MTTSNQESLDGVGVQLDDESKLVTTDPVDPAMEEEESNSTDPSKTLAAQAFMGNFGEIHAPPASKTSKNRSTGSKRVRAPKERADKTIVQFPAKPTVRFFPNLLQFFSSAEILKLDLLIKWFSPHERTLITYSCPQLSTL